MKKVLFIDRDGTIIREPKSDYQVDALDKFSFFPSVIKYLSKIAEELDYQLVLVTNQDGLGTPKYPEDSFWPFQDLMITTLEGEDIHFDDICIDRHFETDGSPNRKPGVGMLGKYLKGNHDLAHSFVIGDRWTDVQLAANLGAKGIFLHEEQGLSASVPAVLEAHLALQTQQWKEIYQYLKKLERSSKMTRVTNETKIDIALTLDGKGYSDIHTGLHFFDHMLEQLVKHGGFDLAIKTVGDLHIDEHHTVEDTAITLGQAFKQAIGTKIGMNRYGFCLPMDDSLAQVAIDFGGRPWIEWQGEFRRERVGDVPTELFYHFFKSFSDQAACNLNIKVEGHNEHHMIESVFKAFAKAIKMAVQRDTSSSVLPSTKGKL